MHSHWTNKVNAQSVADTTVYDNVHTTDVTNQKALAMIDEAAASGNQFFMMVAPGKTDSPVKSDNHFSRTNFSTVAPHLQSGKGTSSSIPPVPAGFAAQFVNEQAPRGANWNPDEPR